MLNRHAHVRIRLIVRRIRNLQETHLSETLTYVLATQQDISTRFCADGLYLRVRGPASTQAKNKVEFLEDNCIAKSFRVSTKRKLSIL